MRVLIAVFALLLGVGGADAHSWYSAECCSGQDCAPVDRSELLTPLQAGLFPGNSQLPTLWVETKHGKGIVPSTMIPRESRDSSMHACIRAGKVICIYLPAGN